MQDGHACAKAYANKLRSRVFPTADGVNLVPLRTGIDWGRGCLYLLSTLLASRYCAQI